MNLENLFCPNLECPARGQTGQGNIVAHSLKEQRCRCTVCHKTFAITKGTPFYRLRTDEQLVTTVMVLLAHGCPLQAIVKAFELDERTVQNWQEKAGTHCEAIHEHVVGQAQLDLEQVQADEIRAKTSGGVLWIAMAIAVTSRLWLGGEVSRQRDKHLIRRLAERIKRMALCRSLLLAVDGLASYVPAFQKAFRTKVPRRRQQGRCQLVAWREIAIVQVIKRRTAEGLAIERRIVQGCSQVIDQLRQKSQGLLGVINTAYIERLNATFRQRIAPLGRRCRHLARQEDTLRTSIYLVGCFYNLCDAHHSLRQQLLLTKNRHRWVAFTPAMAAGLTDHPWTAHELLSFKVPPPRWTPPPQRGRRSKEVLKLIERWC